MQEQLAISLHPKRATATGGGTPAQVVAVIQKQTSVIDSYVLEIAGLDPDWYTLPVTNLALFPGEQKPVNIAFHAPPGLSVLAGSYDYTVRARSMAVTGRLGEATGTLLIVVPEILSIRLKHEIVRGQEGLFELTIANRSRPPQAVALAARDPEGLLDFTFDPPTPTIPAGGSQAVNLRVRVLPGPVMLGERPFRFNIQAKT